MNKMVTVDSDLFFEKDESKKYCNGLYWKYSKESIGSIKLIENNIDGIIFLTTFPCGLDSLVNELVIRKLKILKMRQQIL